MSFWSFDGIRMPTGRAIEKLGCCFVLEGYALWAMRNKAKEIVHLTRGNHIEGMAGLAFDFQLTFDQETLE